MFELKFTEEQLNNIKEFLPEELKALIEYKLSVFQKKENKKKLKKERKLNYKDQKTKELIKRANEFRSNLISKQTDSEKILKAKLKSNSIKYEFQKIVFTKTSFYILDFYLPDYDLVIEVDGEYHFTLEQKTLDNKRSKDLKEIGYKRIRRLKNSEANSITDSELKSIIKK